MANLTANARRPVNTSIRPLEIITVLLASGIEAFQGAILGKRADGYYENAVSTKGGHRELVVVRKYADNRGGGDGALSCEAERGVHVFETWSGTIDLKNEGDDVVMGADNQTIARWDIAALPTAVQLTDANCMSLQGLVPGVTYKVVREGLSKPLTFRVDKAGEITISLKTDGAGAADATMTGTVVTAALNLSPIAGPLARAAALGTGATVVTDVATAVTLSSPRLGKIVRVEPTIAVYVDSTK